MTDRPRKYQHHPVAFKRKLVEASLVPGTSVAALAQQQGINTNQLWAWRKLYREGRLGAIATTEAAPALLPVELIESRPNPAPMPTATGTMEIVIGTACLRMTGKVEPEMLRTAIAALMP